jgi:hypothetical protein
MAAFDPIAKKKALEKPHLAGNFKKYPFGLQSRWVYNVLQ